MKKTMILMLALLSFITANDLNLTRKMIGDNKKVIRNSNGSMIVLHGGTLPTIKTKPLHLTDIQLEEGEVITDVQIGDTVRWQISPTLSGTSDPSTQTSHVIVKAVDTNLTTTLNIMTDKRSYHINLASNESEYNPVVKFAYADNLNKKLEAYNKSIKVKKEQQKIQAEKRKIHVVNRSVDITKLNFNYHIKGSASWKPKRVFNDGKKSYIQMPQMMRFKEAPALMVVTKSGNKIVNYRLKNNTFVVDYLFDAAILILGVGSTQEKITIEKANASKNSILRELGF